MLLRSMRDEGAMRPLDGFFALVRMPVRIAPSLAEKAYATPLNRALSEAGLGRVTGHSVELDENGEPTALTIELSLVTDAPRIFDHVAEFLERLDAPRGSHIGHAECAEVRSFGLCEGLGLYLLRHDTDEDGCIGVAEACTDALEGAGMYQGAHQIADRVALYFYGDSFTKMRTAITYVMTQDPRCRNAYARRLN